MTTFDSMKNNVPDVLDYLDQTLLTDSTITMMNDGYIKKSVCERLSQVVCLTEGVVLLDKDPVALSRAMLRSSLNQKDINFILNASLHVSGIKVNVGGAVVEPVEDTTTEDLTESEIKKQEKREAKRKKEEATVENANAMVKSKMESMGSIESLIEIIQDNRGTSRILQVSSQEAQMEAWAASQAAGNTVEPVKDMINIERPLGLNLDFVDLSKIDNSQLFSFLDSLMAVDSNSSLSITLPIAAFLPAVQEFFNVDLLAVADSTIEFSKASGKNSISFTAEKDPYLSLFDSL